MIPNNVFKIYLGYNNRGKLIKCQDQMNQKGKQETSNS